ncbi:hypothetical protein TruAng_007624 [Truncatella angustata]|nr:hypothetical protein TruAng_007624 [Truncatella angustata]
MKTKSQAKREFRGRHYGQEQSSFFQLLYKEIRTVFYERLIPSGLREFEVFPSQALRAPPSWDGRSLLETCRRIPDEASPILHKKSHPTLRIPRPRLLAAVPWARDACGTPLVEYDLRLADHSGLVGYLWSCFGVPGLAASIERVEIHVGSPWGFWNSWLTEKRYRAVSIFGA